MQLRLCTQPCSRKRCPDMMPAKCPVFASADLSLGVTEMGKVLAIFFAGEDRSLRRLSCTWRSATHLCQTPVGSHCRLSLKNKGDTSRSTGRGFSEPQSMSGLAHRSTKRGVCLTRPCQCPSTALAHSLAISPTARSDMRRIGPGWLTNHRRDLSRLPGGSPARH